MFAVLASIPGLILEGLKFSLALFKARNAPAMQANAKAATFAKIRAAVEEHIRSGDLKAVQEDGATQ